MGYFDSDAREMLDVYLLETRQLSEQLSGVLLDAEKRAGFTEEELHSIFRVMHTIKSSSAMMGLNELSSMAHKLEDLFSYYREEYGKIEGAEPELFDLLFAVSDYIESELDRMAGEDYHPKSIKEIEGRTEDYIQRISRERQEEKEKASSLLPPEKTGSEIPVSFLKKDGVVVRVLFESGCRMENIRAFMLIRQISGLCSEVESYPANLEKSQESAEYIDKNGVFVRFVSRETERVLEIIRQGLFVSGCEILNEEKAEKKRESQPQQGGNARDTEFLQVRAERLDRLQNYASELMISALSLDAELERQELTEIREGVFHQLNRLIAAAEKTVMEMRMVPVSRMVPRLRRILRDICTNQRKDVELIINCGDMEADKSVVDSVSEALIHLLRNAVDHGIETAGEREKAGKPAKGKIIFRAETVSGELRISLADDGQGIDEESVRRRAREMGLFRQPEEDYSRQEILELVLSPGFTTNKEVTEYSGRGVGLDVVNSVLENAGGHLYIASEPGKGSTFTITVPLSLATMECTRFFVGDYRFSVPARYVFRFLEYGKEKENIREQNGRLYILYEDRMIPMVDLRKFYCLEGEAPQTAILVYVKCVEKEGCILADSMYTQKRIVVKQIPPLFGLGFRMNTGIYGFSLMGNGMVCAALDVESLMGRYEKEGTYGRHQYR